MRRKRKRSKGKTTTYIGRWRIGEGWEGIRTGTGEFKLRRK